MKNPSIALLLCASLLATVGCTNLVNVSGMYRTENGDWVELDSKGQMRMSSDCMGIPSTVAYEVVDNKIVTIAHENRYETFSIEGELLIAGEKTYKRTSRRN